MSGDWLEFWRRDLGQTLIRHAETNRTSSVSGVAWLLPGALVALTVGVLLYGAYGYEAGFTRINQAAAVAPDWLWQWLTVLGDERVAFALALLFAWRYPRLLWALLIGAVIAALISRGLKIWVDSARPPAVLAADSFNLIGASRSRTSFPSGHTTTAAVFFGALLSIAGTWKTRLILVLLAIVVGISRVAVGVHWPIDVAAGLAIGAVAAWVGLRLAAHWPGPATNRGVHLFIVVVGVILTLTLFFSDGGYPAAAGLQMLIAVGVLLILIAQYLIGPWQRYRQALY
ncbi:phosphoesterase PA-phosphatase [Thiocapsa imhoffii]|uniref:undecaprenyl-diphosphate phosphatase n=1 Tax=Thiocapsa imhoffii TaxID=382777 RepID=A0A9X0WF87_9GAMM|nr:phosphatase PAP2 family protein [Thiocapsa imhoffii]MBK1643572.1 phosphoesterase PA-phosphatase [Thiocapsa imhoffii]